MELTVERELEKEKETKGLKEGSKKERQETHYIPSQHAAERYAERNWDCPTQADKIKIANLRSEDIRKALNKLCTYGECVYEGPIRQYKTTMVYKKDNWVVLVDPTNNKIITCYPVQLGLDEDFDKEYVNKMSEKLQNAKDERDKIESEVTETKKNFKARIDDNKNKINELKSIIKKYEKENEGLQEVIDSCDGDLRKAQIEVEEIIDSLTRKKN